jgi:hypothetical protein
MDTFGNILNNNLTLAKSTLFLHGEMAQLTYISFEMNVKWVSESKEGTTFPIQIPLGYNPDHTPILSDPRNYTKEELIERYVFLGLKRMPIDSIFQLITTTENLLNDLLRSIFKEYPAKIPSKKKIDAELVLSFSSLDEAKFYIIDAVINDIAYKSPKEYAQDFFAYSGVNLLESPIFHRYIELKATRDIHIHNAGIANEVYLGKAGILARVKNNEKLPVDIQYFLQSYETCLQLVEELEKELDKIWPSSIYRNSEAEPKDKELDVEKIVDALIEKSKLDDQGK